MSTQEIDWLEQKLAEQLTRDRAKPSRRRLEGDTWIVLPSGTACGIAFRLSLLTGEDDLDALMDRVAAEQS